MSPREWTLRAARAASLAAVIGVGVTAFFYAFDTFGSQTIPSGPDSRHIRFENLPKAEEFGWLVGSLAFVALLLTPLPAGRPLVWGSVRAAAGALAVTLPIAAWDNSWSDVSWFAWVFAGIPAFVGLLLTAFPLQAPRA